LLLANPSSFQLVVGCAGSAGGVVVMVCPNRSGGVAGGGVAGGAVAGGAGGAVADGAVAGVAFFAPCGVDQHQYRSTVVNLVPWLIT